MSGNCNPCVPEDPLLKVPNTPITKLGLSFRDIAAQLDNFKKELLKQPITQQFLADPYNQSSETIINLDREWAITANKMVNDMTGVPQGYGKRMLFCANDGSVFVDVSTFVPNTKWLNYSIVAITKFSNYKFIDNPTEPQFNINVNSSSDSFNYEETNWSNVTINPAMQSSNYTILRCGSTTPPVTDINDYLNPERPIAVTFAELDPHTSRQEIIEATTNTYGWCSRYSSTVFSPNYYVATELKGADGYNIFIRLSYFLL